MKLSSLIPGFISASGLLTGACTLSIAIGSVYLLDCRFNLRDDERIDQCYITGASMMGIGISGRGGYNVGFNTLNPALRKPREEGDEGDMERDSLGRFVKKHSRN